MTVKVTWRGDTAKSNLSMAGRVAVRAASERLLEISNQTVPEDELDRLEKSGQATVETRSSDGRFTVPTGVVSYDTPYAIRQHEDLQYRHKNGRRAKWLQRTLGELTGELNALMARVLREAL